VGGGFDVNLIPSEVRVISLIRVSDSNGRIFLDRPILDPNLSPLDEFLNRYKKRISGFQKKAWEEYLIPEGLRDPSPIEKQILINHPNEIGGVLTLLPHNLENSIGFHFFIKRRLLWGIDFFELRDDLLSDGQIESVLEFIPKNKILLARRDLGKINNPFLKDLESQVAVIDYDRELLDYKSGEFSYVSQGQLIQQNKIHQNSNQMPIRILSVHYFREGENFSNLLKKMESYEAKGFHIKMAVEVVNFTELQEGILWQNINPTQRSFLPRSKNGRWQWYRLWSFSTQLINFFREGEGSAPDQPSLYQWIQRKNCGTSFAGLLGSPVVHSFTPHYQGLFFEKWKISVLPIKIEIEEYSLALKLLMELGLVAAAVTSPLKLVAFENCKQSTEVAKFYKSVNTLVKINDGEWLGHNTDDQGLMKLRDEALRIFFLLQNQSNLKNESNLENKTKINEKLFSKNSLAVWGGGGTLPLLRKIFSEAEFFSVQTGQSRENKDLSKWYPEIVIWAGGRLIEAGAKTPPLHWSPNLVVDLNYREDSGGRELALRTGAKYLSGETMFYAQGNAQQIFWEEHFLLK